MKNVILTAIVILTAACNQSSPVRQYDEICQAAFDDGRSQGYDEALKDETSETAETMVSEPVETVVNEFAVEDWEFKFKQCESELLEMRGLCKIVDSQYDGLYEMTTQYRDALRYFDLTDLCHEEKIGFETCRAFFDGVL